MKSVLFISNRYPTSITPTNHVFVQQLVWSFAEMGVDCTVISPVPVNKNLDLLKIPKYLEEKTNNNTIQVYFPRYISFGQKNKFGFKFSNFTATSFTKAVEKQMNKLHLKPSAIYGHFLSPAGICASRIGKKYNIPSFAAYGESTPWSINNFGKDRITNELKNLNGIIAVSSANKDTLIRQNVYSATEIEVFPNAIRSSHFYPRNREISREKFGFHKDAFIVAYVGQFTYRKGIMRVDDAINGIEGIQVAYAGKGDFNPKNEKTIHCKPVNPEDMPYFLSAADVFVLPTLNEGCCNAIVEAIACGLPIISSDLPFNYDILDKNNSILIDPHNVRQIRTAIIKLKESPLKRKDMSLASIEKSKALTLEVRSKGIFDWINSRINKDLSSIENKQEFC